MKFTNIFHLLLAGAFVAGTSSCVDEVKYTPAEPVGLADYYFSTGNPNYQELEEGQTGFSVTLGRLNTENAQTINIQHNAEIDDIFTVPATVTFAAGEGTATVEIVYDETKLVKKKEYVVDLKLDGIPNTPYYLGELAVTCMYNPWTTLGTGIYTDALVCSVFDVEPYSYNVTVQQHPDNPDMYRIKNPYAPGSYPLDGVDYNTEKLYTITFNAEDKKGVYVETSNTGFCANAQYGNILVSSQAYLNMEEGQTLAQQKEAGLCGYVEEGNIVMPVNTLQIAMELYNNGAWAFQNENNQMVLTLPGFKPVSEWAPVGMCDYTDGFAGPFLKTPQPNHTYKVLVEKHKKTKGLYRIVDPFGAESGYTIPASATVSEYITFDVSNPKLVLVGDEIFTPASKLRKGLFVATTTADYELSHSEITKEELIEAGIGGSFENDIIRIPGDQIQGYFSLEPDNVITQTAPYTDVVLDLKNITPWEPAEKKAPKTGIPAGNLKLRK